MTQKTVPFDTSGEERRQYPLTEIEILLICSLDSRNVSAAVRSSWKRRPRGSDQDVSALLVNTAVGGEFVDIFALTYGHGDGKLRFVSQMELGMRTDIIELPRDYTPDQEGFDDWLWQQFLVNDLDELLDLSPNLAGMLGMR